MSTQRDTDHDREKKTMYSKDISTRLFFLLSYNNSYPKQQQQHSALLPVLANQTIPQPNHAQLDSHFQ